VTIISLDENGTRHRIASQETGSVKFNGKCTTTTLSHETLHLSLEDIGYPKACYVDKIHDNQFSFTLKELGDRE
jgi:hypothetical protein